MTKPTSLDDVLARHDADELLRLLDAGADVNELTWHGSLLTRAILAFEAHPRLHGLVGELLRRKADPTLLKDQGGPLFAGVIIRDTEILRMLLEAGAQPNDEWDFPESLYDWAAFDYRFEEYGIDLLPEEPSPQDTESDETWLGFLERLADKYKEATARLSSLATRGRREEGAGTRTRGESCRSGE